MAYHGGIMKLRALRKDKDYTERVEVIQDLRFETATTRIKATPDGEVNVLLVPGDSGIYPPQIKVYELRELALKFERHLDSEIIDFQVLADDYSKLAILCADRSIYLHAKYGKHYSVRIPRMGRDIEYDSWSCDLLCGAFSPDLYRINLQQGRFLSPLSTRSPALNIVSRSKLHGLVACGGEDGAVECFDLRVKSSVGRINATGSDDQGVTAIAFDEDAGFQMAVGNSEGKVLIYDLRSSSPVQVKDHMYGSPILDIKWHHTLNSEQTKLISTDNHIVKIWDPNTEELEESAQATIYENYNFLTKEELERLNLTNLIETNLLRAYMHGYFMKHDLYKKAKSIADPESYDAYIEQQKKEKLEKTFANQITMKRKLPKVNRKSASELLEEEERNAAADDAVEKVPNKKKQRNSEILKDQRFSAMFEHKDFLIDEQSEEYLARHPVTKKQASSIEEHLEPVDEDIDESDASFASTDDASDEEGRARKKRGPRLFEVKNERHADAFFNQASLANEDSLPLGKRVTSLRDDHQGTRFGKHVKVGPGGSREISFIASSAKYKEDEEEDRRGKRRGVRSLGLQGPPSRFQGGGRGGGRGRGRGGRARGRR